MTKALIHIEVTDCLSDCPFSAWFATDMAYCEAEGGGYIDRFPNDCGATPVPNWCPYKEKDTKHV